MDRGESDLRNPEQELVLHLSRIANTKNNIVYRSNTSFSVNISPNHNKQVVQDTTVRASKGFRICLQTLPKLQQEQDSKG
jgi:hypothetical protein